jgi:hypothetical protein
MNGIDEISLSFGMCFNHHQHAADTQEEDVG